MKKQYLKKCMATLMIFTLGCSLAACGSSGNNAVTESKEEATDSGNDSAEESDNRRTDH